MRVHAQVSRRIVDLMLGILRIVTTKERPRALTEGTVNVLHPVGALFFSEDHDIGLKSITTETGREAIEIFHHALVVLHEHGRHRIEFGAELEERVCAELLPPWRVDLMTINVA